MRIRFLEIAEIELDEAIAYYNHEATGLGESFRISVILQRSCRMTLEERSRSAAYGDSMMFS
jgi:hypothetical protein